jgi:hypothetical protein
MSSSREYVRNYAYERRAKARGIKEIEANGYTYILIKATNKRLECKQHDTPSFMGQRGYVLYKIKKNGHRKN